MARSPNAELAVSEFRKIAKQHSLSKDTCWKAIALLFLSCKNWDSGSWHSFKDVIVYREANDFKKASEKSTLMRRAHTLTDLVAHELGWKPNKSIAG